MIQARAVKLPQYLAAHSVAFYNPIQNEVDTYELLEHALALAKKVFYPRMSSKEEPPALYRVMSPSHLAAAKFDIPEPSSSLPMTQSERESLVVFVPGVVFDRHGNRVGRGGGWYDRLLAQLSGTFIGLAYEFQVVEELAAEKWDRKVHYVITEKQVIDCAF